MLPTLPPHLPKVLHLVCQTASLTPCMFRPSTSVLLVSRSMRQTRHPSEYELVMEHEVNALARS